LEHGFIFPSVGNNNPNWLSYFTEGWNHQPALTRLLFKAYYLLLGSPHFRGAQDAWDLLQDPWAWGSWCWCHHHQVVIFASKNGVLGVSTTKRRTKNEPRNLSDFLVCQIHPTWNDGPVWWRFGHTNAGGSSQSGLLYPFPWATLLIDDCGTSWLFSSNIGNIA
jgi:hypothetical protein